MSDPHEKLDGGINWAGLQTNPDRSSAAEDAILKLRLDDDVLVGDAIIRGFSKSMPTPAHRAAMFWAMARGRSELVGWLGAQGCNIEMTDDGLVRALVEVAARSRNPSILDIIAGQLSDARLDQFVMAMANRFHEEMRMGGGGWRGLAGMNFIDGGYLEWAATALTWVGRLPGRDAAGGHTPGVLHAGRALRDDVVTALLFGNDGKWIDYDSTSGRRLAQVVLSLPGTTADWTMCFRRAIKMAGSEDSECGRLAAGRIARGLAVIGPFIAQDGPCRSGWLDANQSFADEAGRLADGARKWFNVSSDAAIVVALRVWPLAELMGFDASACLTRYERRNRGHLIGDVGFLAQAWNAGFLDYRDTVLRKYPQVACVLAGDPQTGREMRQQLEAHPEKLTIFLETSTNTDAIKLLQACGIDGAWRDSKGNTVAHHIAAILKADQSRAAANSFGALLTLAGTADLGVKNCAGETFESITRSWCKDSAVMASIEQRVMAKVATGAKTAPSTGMRM